MYGRGVLFVPGTRCGGVRKAYSVWRQVATARGPESSAARHALGCHDCDRLEAILYPTSHLIKGSVRFDDHFETAHPSPNRF